MLDDLGQLAGLPERYDYIRDVVMKYTCPGREFREKWKKFVSELNTDQVDEIREVYDRMRTQSDAEGLSAWIEERIPEIGRAWDAWNDSFGHASLGGKPVPPEPQPVPRAQRLFELFGYLKDLGVKPFDSGSVDYCPPEKLDWKKLPPELAYLREPAIKWGIHRFDYELWKTARNIARRRPKELEELQAVASRINAPDDQERINEFLAKYPAHLYPVGARVSSVRGLIGELDQLGVIE